MNTTVIGICAICLLIAIFLDTKYEVPLGLSTMLAAFVISNLAFGMNANKVIAAYFPATVVLPLLLALAFFSVFSANGTSQVIAHKLLGAIRGNMKLYPWTLFAICTLLYTFLDGGTLRYIIAPLVFSIAKQGGSSTLMAVSTAYLPYMAGSLNPYIGIGSSTRTGILADMGLQNASNIHAAMWINSLVLITALHLFIYLITKSWKVPNMGFTGGGESTAINPEQKRSLIVLSATVAMFVLPPLFTAAVPCSFTASLESVFNYYVVFICGILGIILTGLGDWRRMLRAVPLKPIMMIIGVTFLIKTAQHAGLQELCVAAATGVPHWLIPSALILIGAALSFFVAAPTVLPMLFPLAVSIASTPAEAITYLSCVAVGLLASAISPISNSGVAFLSTVDIKEHEKYSKYMFIMAFLSPAFMSALAAAGLLNILSGFFAGWYY